MTKDERLNRDKIAGEYMLVKIDAKKSKRKIDQ